MYYNSVWNQDSTTYDNENNKYHRIKKDRKNIWSTVADTEDIARKKFEAWNTKYEKVINNLVDIVYRHPLSPKIESLETRIFDNKKEMKVIISQLKKEQNLPESGLIMNIESKRAHDYLYNL